MLLAHPTGAKVESVRVTDAPFPYAVELVTADGLREYLVAEKQTHVDLWTRALEGVITSLKAFPALHLARSKKRGTVTLPDPPSMPLAMLDGPLPDATANAQAAVSTIPTKRLWVCSVFLTLVLVHCTACRHPPNNPQDHL